MKVAIIGAGVSGLSCALALEKRGIVPDIFEQFDRCGGRVPFKTNILQIIYRPVKDPLTVLREKYELDVTPVNPLNTLVRFSATKVSKSAGQLGHAFEIGPSARSINNEIYGKLSAARVQFNTVADFKELSASYDKVVVATGTPYVAKELGCWSDIMRTWVRGAVVEGRFDPTRWLVWYDPTYFNAGYAYLGPFDDRSASIVAVLENVREDEVEPKWRFFLDRKKIRYPEKQGFILEHIVGFCSKREIDNIMLVGNSGGFLESIFGFGLYGAMISGTLAAEAIAENSPFDPKVSFLDQRLYECFLLRQALFKFKPKDYDNLMTMFNIKPLDRLIYNTNFDVIKHTAGLLRH